MRLLEFPFDHCEELAEVCPEQAVISQRVKCRAGLLRRIVGK